MKYTYFLLFALICAAISGCSTTANSSISSVIQNRDKSYLTAKTIPPLRIPPGISSDTLQNMYPIADKNYPEESKKVSLVPPGLNS